MNQRSNQPYRRSSPQSGSSGQHRSNQNRSDHHQNQSRSGHDRSSKQQHHHHRHKRHYNAGHIQEVVTHASRRLANHSLFGMFILALMGGGLVTLGAYFGITLASTSTSTTVQSLFMTVGIATGLFITVGLNAILFIEPNVIMPSNLYNTTVGQGFGRLFKFWIIAWIGNFFGALAFAWLIKLGSSYSTESITFLQTFVSDRLTTSAGGSSMGFFDLFFSGVLGNWVLGFALIYSVYNRAAVGKLFILMFTVGLIIVTNLQTFPINLSFFSILSANGAATQSMFEMIVNNLIPVSIGNLVGGAFLVALPLLFQTNKARAK